MSTAEGCSSDEPLAGGSEQTKVESVTIDVPLHGSAGGEDAAAIARAWDDVFLLIVCDGMGGAGSRRVCGDAGEQSEAAYAACAASEALRDTFLSVPSDRTLTPDDLKRAADELRSRFRELAGTLKPVVVGGPSITGTLRRRLPTTVAVARGIRQGTEWDVDLVWAGDSRAYLLTASSGLQQLTKDDIEGSPEVLEIARGADAPLTNVVDASGRFELQHRLLRLSASQPSLFLVATDGFFTWARSPMVFEHKLISAFSNVSDLQDWARRLTDDLTASFQDDASAAAVVFGSGGLVGLCERIGDRLSKLHIQLDALAAIDNELHRHRACLSDAEKRLMIQLDATWGAYSKGYLARLNQAGRSDP